MAYQDEHHRGISYLEYGWPIWLQDSFCLCWGHSSFGSGNLNESHSWHADVPYWVQNTVKTSYETVRNLRRWHVDNPFDRFDSLRNHWERSQPSGANNARGLTSQNLWRIFHWLEKAVTLLLERVLFPLDKNAENQIVLNTTARLSYPRNCKRYFPFLGSKFALGNFRAPSWTTLQCSFLQILNPSRMYSKNWREVEFALKISSRKSP